MTRHLVENELPEKLLLSLQKKMQVMWACVSSCKQSCLRKNNHVGVYATNKGSWCEQNVRFLGQVNRLRVLPFCLAYAA